MNGYQYGITGFYFSADDAPAWSGTYTVNLEGNPTQWDTLPTPSIWAIASGDYSTGIDQIDNQDELELWLYDAVQAIETDWDVPGELATSTASGIVLLVAGQYYMTGAIPGLNYMAPDIFIMTDAPIEYPDDADWPNNRGEAEETSYTGTPIEATKDLLSTCMGGINPTIASAISVFLGIFALMILSFAKWQTTEYAYMVAPPILYYGARLTFIPWVIFGLACFSAIAYFLWMKFGKFG